MEIEREWLKDSVEGGEANENNEKWNHGRWEGRNYSDFDKHIVVREMNEND